MKLNDQKIVNFNEFCPICKHWTKAESEEPCCDCLENPTNTYSRKPVFYEENLKSSSQDQSNKMKRERGGRNE